jgi:hypothetical protein
MYCSSNRRSNFKGWKKGGDEGGKRINLSGNGKDDLGNFS